MGAVYLLTCSVSGKQYVGLTSRSPERRFAEHVSDSRNKKHHALHRAIAKHGPDSFSIETLALSDDRDELSRLEVAAIELFNTRAPNGYNLTGGGEAPIGEHHPNFGSETHSRFMRENNPMANPLHRAKLQGENHPLFGKKMPREWVEKMAVTKRGTVKMYNSTTSEERGVKPCDVALFVELGWVKGRRPMTDAWRNNMGKSRVGIKVSDETRVKMSIAGRANGDRKNGPLRESADRLMSAGMSREDVETIMFLKPGRVKALRRKRAHSPVTIDGTAETVL